MPQGSCATLCCVSQLSPDPPRVSLPLQGHTQHHGPGRFLLRPHEHRGHSRHCQLYGDSSGGRRAGAARASACAHHRGSPCQQHGGSGGSADGGAGGGVGGLPRRETREGQRAGKVFATQAACSRSAEQGWELLCCGWVVAEVCMRGLKALWPAQRAPSRGAGRNERSAPTTPFSLVDGESTLIVPLSWGCRIQW